MTHTLTGSVGKADCQQFWGHSSRQPEALGGGEGQGFM